MIESEKGKNILVKHICPDSCKSYNGRVGERTCKYHREIGKTFDINHLGPKGMCLDLYYAAYPYCLALLHDAEFSWMKQKNPNSVQAQCPAPTKSIYFEVNRKKLEQPIESQGVKKDKIITIKINKIEDSEGEYCNNCVNCPHYPGQEFEFNQGDFLNYLCPAAFYNLWPTIKTIINNGEIPWKNKETNKVHARCPDNDTRIAFEIEKIDNQNETQNNE